MTAAVFIFALIAGNLICGDTVAVISIQRFSARNVLIILKLIPILERSIKKISPANAVCLP